MTYELIIGIYNMFSAADGYILGFYRGENLYMVRLYSKHIPMKWLRNSRTSSKRGACTQVRVYIPAEDMDKMVASGRAKYIGHKSLLTSNKKYNKGDNFERVIFEMYTGKKWKKDTTPFYRSGDMTYRNRKIQIKLNGAELTNAKTIKNLCFDIGQALRA